MAELGIIEADMDKESLVSEVGDEANGVPKTMEGNDDKAEKGEGTEAEAGGSRLPTDLRKEEMVFAVRKMVSYIREDGRARVFPQPEMYVRCLEGGLEIENDLTAALESGSDADVVKSKKDLEKFLTKNGQYPFNSCRIRTIFSVPFHFPFHSVDEFLMSALFDAFLACF